MGSHPSKCLREAHGRFQNEAESKDQAMGEVGKARGGIWAVPGSLTWILMG